MKRPTHGLRLLGSLVVLGSVVMYALVARTGSPAAGHPIQSTRMVSYYPAQNAWWYMWTRFDPAPIAADFRRIHQAGFDTVRIFVPPQAFGYPEPQPVMNERLQRVVDLAGAAHLRVGIALFDRFESYDDLQGSRQWMDGIVQPLAHDRRIAFFEVRNEVDAYDPAARAWTAAMVERLRSDDPRAPVVVSTSGTQSVRGLAKLAAALRHDPPDTYMLHYYGDPSLMGHTFAEARAAVGNAPLMLGEIGYATDPGNPATDDLPHEVWAQQAEQSLVLRSALLAARENGITGFGVWTWTDFAPGAMPPDVNRSHDPSEYAFGLVSADGMPKPALAALTTAFKRGVISHYQNFDFAQAGPTGPGLMPTDWRAFDSAHAEVAADPTVGRDGLGSARISSSGGTSDRVPSFYQRVMGTVLPGQMYGVRAWARGADATGLTQVSVSWFDADGHFISTNNSNPLPTGTTGWMPLTVRERAPAGAVAMEVHLKSSGNSGSVWFDDVEVR